MNGQNQNLKTEHICNNIEMVDFDMQLLQICSVCGKIIIIKKLYLTEKKKKKAKKK